MPEPEAAQQLIEEHIDSLGEQKAQLERALGHLQGSAPAEAQGARRGQGAGDRGRRQTQAGGNEAAENAPRAEPAAAK